MSFTQIQVLNSLVSGSTITKAAENAGVDRSTIYDWLRRNAHFVAELNRAKRESLESTQRAIQMLSENAVSALRSILTAKATPASVRLKAALSVLDALGAMRTSGAEAEVHPEDIHYDWLRSDKARERDFSSL